MSTLKQTIQDDIKNAMRNKDKPRLDTLRLLSAALKQKEVDERIELTDEQIIAIIEKMLKQRRESIAQYEKGDRMDLAEQERFEMGILEVYLPAQLSEEAILVAIDKAILVTEAKEPKDMGKVMAILKPALAGQAEMGRVSALVKAKLS